MQKTSTVPRTIGHNVAFRGPRPWIDVTAYGASPTASAATNKAAIQAAIDAANTAGGGVVYLPYIGSYSIDGQLTLYSNVWVRGAGPGTVLALATASSFAVFRCDGTQGSTANFSSNGAIGDTSIALASDLGLAAGDYVILDNGSSSSYQVSRVRSTSGGGLTVNLTEPLAQAFTTAASSFARKMTPVSDLTISDLTLDGTSAVHADAGGVVAFYTANLRVERVKLRSFNGSGLFAWGGYGITLTDVSVDDSGNGSYADVHLWRQSVWAVRNLRSSRASGFGPELGLCNWGQASGITSSDASARAFKLSAACFNQFSDVACLAGQSTGLSITGGSCDNVFHGARAQHNGAAGGGTNGAGVWFEGSSSRNQLYGVDTRFNNTRSVEVEAGSNDNVIVGRIDLTGILNNGTGTMIRTPTAGQSVVATGVTSAPTTTSSSYADLAEMTVTLTTTGGPLVAEASVQIIHSTAGEATTCAFSLDGAGEVQQRSATISTNNGYATIALLHRFTGVSAGSHTVKVRWLTTGGTATAGTTQRVLRVTEGNYA